MQGEGRSRKQSHPFEKNSKDFTCTPNNSRGVAERKNKRKFSVHLSVVSWGGDIKWGFRKAPGLEVRSQTRTALG